MSKKILAIFIIASMLFSAFGFVVNADEGITTIDALNAAVIAGGNVTLASDIEGELIIPEGANVTLDLAGFELKSTSGDTISNHGTITIRGEGKITSTGNSKGAIVNYPEGNVTIENGTIYAESWYSIKNMGTMRITDGNVSKGTNGASVIANGWYGNSATDRNTTGVPDTARLTIDGGVFTGEGKSSTIIKNDDYGILIINNGELTSSSDVTDINAGPVVLNWHDAIINGGTFISTNGSVLANGYLSDDADKGELKVNGGNFISQTDAAILANNGGAVADKGSVLIEGGNFAGRIEGQTPYSVLVKGGNFSKLVEESKLDESLKVVLKRANSEYAYSYYQTKEEAMEVAEIGDEIDGEIVEAPKEYTLIFKDGYTENDAGHILKVKNGDDVTAPILEREGYEFKAWNPEVPAKFEAQNDEDGNEIEEYVFTAEWEKKQHSSGGNTDEEWQNPYDDVTSDKWYFKAVKRATQGKLVNGMTATKYMPDENLTRGMAITILYRLDGNNEKYDVKFDDVNAEAYYGAAIGWAANNKIALGTGNNKFEPDEKITREDLATIVYRYAKLKEKGYEEGENFELDYDDKREISNYAIEAISWCTKKHIIEGKNGNKVDAKTSATRAEAAKIFVLFAEGLEK